MTAETLDLDSEAIAAIAKTWLDNAAPDGHVALEPDTMEQDLARLVLTLIELLRRLLELQAVRRAEGGSLEEAEIERLGLALMRSRETLEMLCGQFGLSVEDLNLDLGPLGKLL